MQTQLGSSLRPTNFASSSPPLPSTSVIFPPLFSPPFHSLVNHFLHSTILSQSLFTQEGKAKMASPFVSNKAISFSSSLSSSPLPRLLPSVSSSSIRFKSTPRRILMVRSKIREIFMPALSSTMTEGKIVSWIKSEGDKLSKGESVVVVESDKADMDVETFYDGILAAIVVGEGEVAPVGAAIGILAETEEEIAEAKAKAASKSGASTPSAPPPSPAPAPAPAATSTPASPKPMPAPAAAPVAEGPRKIVATPFAKKLAKQHKVNIESVVGTGPYGRITPADIEATIVIRHPLTPSCSKFHFSVKNGHGSLKYQRLVDESNSTLTFFEVSSSNSCECKNF